MVGLGAQLPVGRLFDAIVIDEAQDFADRWWPAVARRAEGRGRPAGSTSSPTRVSGSSPGSAARRPDSSRSCSTRTSATPGRSPSRFSTLAPIRMRLGDVDGPDGAVRRVLRRTTPSTSRTTQVDVLLDEGWRPEDVALLTTGSRHPEQKARQAAGPGRVLGHVLGPRPGLLRPRPRLQGAGATGRGPRAQRGSPAERSRERLYVGLSRARDQLVVVGDPDVRGRGRRLGGAPSPVRSR